MRNLSKVIMSILVFILIFGSFDYVMAHSMPYSLTPTNPNLESLKIAYNQSNPKAIYNNFNIDIDSEEYFFNLTIFPSALSGEVFLILTNETSGGLMKLGVNNIAMQLQNVNSKVAIKLRDFGNLVPFGKTYDNHTQSYLNESYLGFAMQRGIIEPNSNVSWNLLITFNLYRIVSDSYIYIYLPIKKVTLDFGQVPVNTSLI